MKFNRLTPPCSALPGSTQHEPAPRMMHSGANPNSSVMDSRTTSAPSLISRAGTLAGLTCSAVLSLRTEDETLPSMNIFVSIYLCLLCHVSVSREEEEEELSNGRHGSRRRRHAVTHIQNTRVYLLHIFDLHICEIVQVCSISKIYCALCYYVFLYVVFFVFFGCPFL